MSSFDRASREVVTGLSDPLLLSMVSAGANELIHRGLRAPANLEELLRVSATGLQSSLEQITFLADGRLEVNHPEEFIVVDGKIEYLPATSFGILSLLAKRADKPVNRNLVLKALWPNNPGRPTNNPTHRVTQAVSRLRSELGVEDLGHKSRGVIRTIYGGGFVALSSLKRI